MRARAQLLRGPARRRRRTVDARTGRGEGGRCITFLLPSAAGRSELEVLRAGLARRREEVARRPWAAPDLTRIAEELRRLERERTPQV